MRIETEIKLDFKDVLFKPKRSTLTSRKDVNLTRTIKLPHSKRVWEGIPIAAANMDTVATFEAGKVLTDLNMMVCLHKHYTEEQYMEIYNWVYSNQGCGYAPYWVYSMGISDDEFDRLVRIQDKTNGMILTICIDVANGYTERFTEFVSKVREKYPLSIIIAGNVVTAEITEQLILAGADIVKVGIGSGSACTTRIQAGVGYPQLSAVIECADAAHGLGGRIMSDGGCTCPGDVAKAFGGGADFVMLGGMLAGHEENIKLDNEGNALFYGMSSDTAMNKYHGGVNNYRSSEGRTIAIDQRGPIKVTLQSILGGIRSTCTYIGASELRELSKCTTFIRVRQQYNQVFESKTIKG
tara:strand:- start:248 stop:1306 length:1059 start_codon:yes stop_codon:yes gene_type:complete